MYLRLIPCAFPFCSGVLLNWWDRVERHFSPFSIHNAAEAVVTPHPDKYHNYHLCLSQLSRLSIDCHIHHTCTRRGAWCVSFYREVKVRFSAAVSLQNPTVGRSVVKCPLVDQIELGQSLHSSQLMTFLLRGAGDWRGAQMSKRKEAMGRTPDWRPSQISITDVFKQEGEKTRGLRRNITG